ncbi:MAG: ADYC domain-containing protein [Myxococcota bacterium]
MNGSNTISILAMCMTLGATACDQSVGTRADSDQDLRTGRVDNGRRMTLNTNAWISSSARDLHEFNDTGTPFINSYGYTSTLTSVSHPDTIFGALDTPVLDTSDDVARIRLDMEGDFQFQVWGADSVAEPDATLVGEDLIGLTLHFQMAHDFGGEYFVDLEVVDHMVGPNDYDLYELVRVDPTNGIRVSLCEESADYGRFARVANYLHVDGSTGDMEIQAAELRHIACMAGVPGKTMALGYEATDSTEDEFLLATRVVRADYCADGEPYTYPGNVFSAVDNTDGPVTLAEVEAGLGEYQQLEAVWDEYGVLCVGTPRVSNTEREDIVCPIKFFADGSVSHNWQPPSCDDFEDTGAAGDLRIYSVTRS